VDQSDEQKPTTEANASLGQRRAQSFGDIDY
jgi:hypothetical protein